MTLEAASASGLPLGTLAVRTGMITPRELQQALALQARETAGGKLPRQLGLILLSGGWLSENELETLLEHQQAFRGPGRSA